MTILSKRDVIARINAFCDRFETYAEAAAAIPCTPSQLSQARLGQTGLIPAPILKRLKISIVTSYESHDKPGKAPRKPAKGTAAKAPPVSAKKPKARPAKAPATRATVPTRPEKGDTTPPPEKVAKGPLQKAMERAAKTGGTVTVDLPLPLRKKPRQPVEFEPEEEDEGAFNANDDMPGSTFAVFGNGEDQ